MGRIPLPTLLVAPDDREVVVDVFIWEWCEGSSLRGAAPSANGGHTTTEARAFRVATNSRLVNTEHVT
jgi:hypothetical protein